MSVWVCEGCGEVFRSRSSFKSIGGAYMHFVDFGIDCGPVVELVKASDIPDAGLLIENRRLQAELDEFFGKQEADVAEMVEGQVSEILGAAAVDGFDLGVAALRAALREWVEACDVYRTTPVGPGHTDDFVRALARRQVAEDCLMDLARKNTI